MAPLSNLFNGFNLELFGKTFGTNGVTYVSGETLSLAAVIAASLTTPIAHADAGIGAGVTGGLLPMDQAECIEVLSRLITNQEFRVSLTLSASEFCDSKVQGG